MDFKAKFFITSFLVLSTILFHSANAAGPVKVDVNFDVKHILGDVTTFDRNKFVVIHANTTEREWDGDNFVPDLRDDFLNGYDVYLGRDTGGISWWLNAKVKEDPARAGYADTMDIYNFGQQSIANYAANTGLHSYESRNDQVICAQLHPFWPDGQQTQNGWAFSQADTQSEPFGTATGEYMGRYIKDFFGAGGASGPARPLYAEIINEPLWHLVDYGSETPEKIFKFHSAVASELKKYNPQILVGGYVTAFPNHEVNNFAEWNDRWKLFMDLAGANMDFWSIHLYDFPSINNGKHLYRKGSNMEATFDLMEQYSQMSFGVVKPFLISEFGAQMHDYFGAWSAYRDWLHIKSVNSMMMQFMERANVITKAINFLPVKAEWGTVDVNNTYNHRLMRKENEPTSYTGQWVYSEMVKTYQLWSEVKGTRVDTYSTDLDIMTDAYVDGNTAYLILNNLKFEDTEIQLNFDGFAGNSIASTNIKHLHLSGDVPVLEETNPVNPPETVMLAAESTMILKLQFDQTVPITESSRELKYFASTYLQPIVAGKVNTFQINNVEKGAFGEAVLRLGIGRDHGKSLTPKVTVNGTELKMYDKNYRGDDQADRDTFFGVLELDVPADLLQTTNEIKVTFDDDGGTISSVALRNYIYTRDMARSQKVITGLPSVDFTGSVKIYPNPSDGLVSLEVDESMNGLPWAVYSAMGHMVAGGTINAQKSMVNTVDWPKGLYCFKLGQGKNMIVRKLVVK